MRFRLKFGGGGGGGGGGSQVGRCGLKASELGIRRKGS